MPRLPEDFRQRLLPIALSQGVGVLCGIIGVRLATQLVPPALYGQYGVLLSFAPLGQWVVHAGLVRYVNRHWAATTERSSGAAALVTLAVRRLPWLLLACGIAALSLDAWNWITATALLFGTAAFLSFGAFAQAALQADRSHWRDLAANTALGVTRTFLPLLLFAATGVAVALPAGLLLSALSFAAVAALVLGVMPRRSGPTLELPPAYVGALFPLLALSGWALTGVTRWVAAGYLAPETAGYFTLANNVGAILPGVFVAIAIQYAQPGWFAQPHATMDERRALLRQVDRTAAKFVIVTLIALGALHLVAPWLVGPLIHEKFRPAIGYLFPAGCFAVATATAAFYQSLLLAARRENRIGGIEVVFAIGLLFAGAAAGWAGEAWFRAWLIAAPAWPWLCYRTLARRALLRPDAPAAPAPGL